MAFFFCNIWHTRAMFRNFLKKHKSAIVLIGDICIFTVSLALTICVRYDTSLFAQNFTIHIAAFRILLILWFFVFYAADLYSYTSWRNSTQNLRKFIIAFLLNFFLSISVFYVFGNFFELTPKLNLIIFSLFFVFLDLAWRFIISQTLSSKNNNRTIAIFSSSPLSEEIISHCKQHPQLGYTVQIHKDITHIRSIIPANKERIIILIDDAHTKDPETIKILYELLAQHIEITTLVDFYENLMGRVPLSEIKEEWFIQKIKADKSFYETIKRVFDICFALIAMIIFSPFFLIFTILIPLTSPGKTIYKQKRVGRDGVIFTLYKFRSMQKNAEKDGAMWAQTNDLRTTKIGNFLRRSHLDELPQLFNILRGDVSFVGPRPERPEFTEILSKEIPHYFMRQIVTPGITGWAQIKFRYANSIADSREKFEYDLYYIKNQNIFADIGIIIKTIKLFF